MLLITDKTVDIKRITATVIGEMNVIDLNNIEKYRENNRIEAKRQQADYLKACGKHIHPLQIHSEELYF